jgi:hypothetical protein
MLTAELALSAWGALAGTLGFSKRGIMNGPDGKPIHAELMLEFLRNPPPRSILSIGELFTAQLSGVLCISSLGPRSI